MNKNGGLFVGGILTEAFGVSSPIFIPWGGKLPGYTPGKYGNVPTERVPGEAGTFSGIELVNLEEAERLSGMGTPVLGTFTFQAGEYNTYDTQGRIVQKSFADFLFPYATLVDFTRQMNMTQTKVLGSAGTVKEVYGLDDWTINIRGVCLTDESRPAQKTAAEQIAELIRWRTVADTINVAGALFNNKEIYALVIKSFSISPEAGKPSVIPFTIEAVSDEPIELVL